MDKKKRNTIIATAVILIAAIGGMAIQNYQRQQEKKTDAENKPKKYAVIQHHSEEPIRLDLSEDQTLTVGDKESGGYNIIEVKDGYISVTEADCPDQICVSQGKVQSRLDIIACLPHELIITIETEDDENADIDTKSW